MHTDDDRLEHALELAYRHLNRRERTVTEVRRHLERRGLESALIDQAIAALVDHGYLDDARYIRLYVEDKRELEQWGSGRIRRELRARGIDPELIDQALCAQAPAGERDRAVGVLERRFPVAPADRRQRERALGVLLRKGYDGELALEALGAYARDRGQSEPR